jgi:hypothetical protein
MKQQTVRNRGVLIALAAATLSVQLGAGGRAAVGPARAECEGDACAQVTLSFDEAKGLYRARNSSADRWARVSASNLAASARVCLAPGGEGHLELKSIVGAYRAERAEPKCGALGVGQ